MTKTALSLQFAIEVSTEKKSEIFQLYEFYRLKWNSLMKSTLNFFKADIKIFKDGTTCTYIWYVIIYYYTCYM